jgi:phosphate transport system substrate-binding protein
VSYNPTGSGAGREQFIAGHVDFAGSDSPLVADQIGPAAKRCDENPAWDLPLVFGPVALVYNLPGVQTLVVSSDALAQIFSGRITVWNDPLLAALNPGVALPDTKIVPIYRADSSGTTDNVQKYLTAAAPQSWTKGVGTEFQGGVGEGATKSAGVIQAVRTTRDSIGYVEKGFADQARLPYAQIDTGNGVVPLTNDTASNAINAARFAADGNDLVLDLNPMYDTKDPHAYPLVLATYEIVCSTGYDPDTSRAIKSFLAVAADNGQGGLSSAGYVPLPDKVKERLVTAINALQ